MAYNGSNECDWVCNVYICFGVCVYVAWVCTFMSIFVCGNGVRYFSVSDSLGGN